MRFTSTHCRAIRGVQTATRNRISSRCNVSSSSLSILSVSRTHSQLLIISRRCRLFAATFYFVLTFILSDRKWMYILIRPDGVFLSSCGSLSSGCIVRTVTRSCAPSFLVTQVFPTSRVDRSVYANSAYFSRPYVARSTSADVRERTRDVTRVVGRE